MPISYATPSSSSQGMMQLMMSMAYDTAAVNARKNEVDRRERELERKERMYEEQADKINFMALAAKSFNFFLPPHNS
jgi:3-deoxy-D-arabino-heptulosonate 7-phosphate (DAHP) synthase class II